jgi:lysozyme
MKTSTKGLIALMGREGVVLSTYKDSVGVATIGVGHTAAAGDPKPVSGLKITLAEALEIFRRDIVKYEDRVNDAVTVPLAQHEFDALVSFDFNTGGIYKAKLTIALNAGDRAGAAAGFMGWTKPPEIKNRRLGEQRQFATGDYGDLSTVLVYEKFPGTAVPVSTDGLLEPTSAPSVEERLAALEAAYEGIMKQLPPAGLADRVAALEAAARGTAAPWWHGE